MNALAPLGMVSGIPSDNPVQSGLVPLVEDLAVEDLAVGDLAKDYFVERDGMKFAGMHLLVDIWTATDLDDPQHIDGTLCDAARAAGATILHRHFHHFTPNGGVSGVVVLAESHISIHTWPERQFAAVDVFMCGSCDPYRSVPMLRRAFNAKRVDLSEQRRGRVTR